MTALRCLLFPLVFLVAGLMIALLIVTLLTDERDMPLIIPTGDGTMVVIPQ